MAESPSTEDYSTTSPTASPKPRYGDRFMPNRGSNTWDKIFLTPSTSSPDVSSEKRGSTNQTPATPPMPKKSRLQPSSPLYSTLLQNEILGNPLEISPAKRILGFGRLATNKPSSAVRRLFHFDNQERPSDLPPPFSCSAISQRSQEMVERMSKPYRRVDRIPFKILDAPDLLDDFYLNVVDWSAKDYLAVGLGGRAYISNPLVPRARVILMCDLNNSDSNDTEVTNEDYISSVSWDGRGERLAVGTSRGEYQIWDLFTEKLITSCHVHTGRVSCLSWCESDTVFSGSKDRAIVQMDLRQPPRQIVRELRGHTQEVCGLKWSQPNQALASGGNDNVVRIWSLQKPEPVLVLKEHGAAVKALDWSPHQLGILATGGGSLDKYIKIWNTHLGLSVQSVLCESQVCNLLWSKNSNELVTSHGYLANEIIVWAYPDFRKIASLRGHAKRVVYMAMSPDGRSIVTGGGDETLRFWKIFDPLRRPKDIGSPLRLHCRFWYVDPYPTSAHEAQVLFNLT